MGDIRRPGPWHMTAGSKPLLCAGLESMNSRVRLMVPVCVVLRKLFGLVRRWRRLNRLRPQPSLFRAALGDGPSPSAPSQMRCSGASDNTVAMPSIQLPLDGDQPEDWLLLIVSAPTGVSYEQQYGGHLCNHAEVEGFLVPVCQPEVLAQLREAFADPRLGGRGILGTQGLGGRSGR